MLGNSLEPFRDLTRLPCLDEDAFEEQTLTAVRLQLNKSHPAACFEITAFPQRGLMPASALTPAERKHAILLTL